MSNKKPGGSKSTFEKIMLNLQNLGIEFEHDARLVRGMDYYSSFVFEFTTEDLGSQGAVIAGGRYDSLISTMGGKETPAAGFAGGGGVLLGGLGVLPDTSL